MNRISYKDVLASPSLYPVTACWLAGIVTLMLVAAGKLSVSQGVGVLWFSAILIVLVATQRELRSVHLLVTSDMKQIAELKKLVESLGGDITDLKEG